MRHEHPHFPDSYYARPDHQEDFHDAGRHKRLDNSITLEDELELQEEKEAREEFPSYVLKRGLLIDFNDEDEESVGMFEYAARVPAEFTTEDLQRLLPQDWHVLIMYSDLEKEGEEDDSEPGWVVQFAVEIPSYLEPTLDTTTVKLVAALNQLFP